MIFLDSCLRRNDKRGPNSFEKRNPFLICSSIIELQGGVSKIQLFLLHSPDYCFYRNEGWVFPWSLACAGMRRNFG